MNKKEKGKCMGRRKGFGGRVCRMAALAATLLMMIALSGCSMVSEEKVKLKDLEFTILSEEKIPAELKSLIEERQKEPFQLTYRDQEFLYICAGYGEQATGGYSITVDELYLTEDAIYVSTTLLGPENAKQGESAPSYPYIVIKTEGLEQSVIFE